MTEEIVAVVVVVGARRIDVGSVVVWNLCFSVCMMSGVVLGV